MKSFAFTWPKKCSSSEDRCLILTIKGGSGHLQATRAKKAEIEKDNPSTKTFVTDILTDWLGTTIGSFITRRWNKSQRKGDLVKLGFYSGLQSVTDLIFFTPIFIASFCELTTKKISWVVDTQNLALRAIVKAIRLVQFITGEKIYYEKIVTDLPTKEAYHFFKPIRGLSRKDRAIITLVTTRPLLEGETEEDFWAQNCKLPLSQIRYDSFPLRPSFKDLSKTDCKAPLELDFSVNSSSELELVKKAFSKGTLNPDFHSGGFKLTIPCEHKVSVIMLGGNPQEDAIIDYIQHFIKICSEKNFKTRKENLFVFCNDLSPKSSSFLKRIVSLIERTKNYPKSLTIIPLSYQEDKVVAPLFHRSDATFTRSGGLTSMEILSVCKGQVWIHRETPPKNLPRFFLNFKTVHEGMPPWEKGNAMYLMAKKGALFISPETFKDVSSSYFVE